MASAELAGKSSLRFRLRALWPPWQVAEGSREWDLLDACRQTLSVPGQ